MEDKFFTYPTWDTCTITQGYHPPKHPAVDLSMVVGTEIRSGTSGTVMRARKDKNGNIYVAIQSHDRPEFSLWYFHLSKILVREGDFVGAGKMGNALVALSGNTGPSTGPHLHYEVRVNYDWSSGSHKNVDPFSVTQDVGLKHIPEHNKMKEINEIANEIKRLNEKIILLSS